jgi:hypothetical protein
LLWNIGVIGGGMLIIFVVLFVIKMYFKKKYDKLLGIQDLFMANRDSIEVNINENY